MRHHLLSMLASLLGLTTLTGCPEEALDCTSHEDCSDTQVCIRSSCQPAYGVDYDITVVNIQGTLPSGPPEGGMWDEAGGYPDPYLILRDQEGAECSTRADEDVLSPRWDFLCDPSFTVDEDSRYAWEIYDDDEEDDPLMAASAEGEEFQILVEWIRAAYDDPSATFSNSSSGVTVNFRIAGD